MREAGFHVCEILNILVSSSVPGVSTFELDQIAKQELDKRNLKSPFIGYHGYPSYLCTSINDAIVHGIPHKKVLLREGDILSLDFGVIYKGYVADSARTIPIGRISDLADRLIKTTEVSLQKAIECCTVGGRIWDIGKVVSSFAESYGYSIVRDFVGHGIGRKMHELPQVPNYFSQESSLRMKKGLVIAIEPMVNVGGPGVRLLKDGWTAKTMDGSLSAHFEDTIAITENGPWVLTKN